ncbi:MAG: hypothetical protein KJ069_16265 [Anaerolineae bacterium]|nr:hypothetical protein [Anaerolineae bacterium]
MKKCATCGNTKEEAEYYWRDKQVGKRWGTCKDCQKKQRHDWYERNKDEHKKNTINRKRQAVRDARGFVWDYLATHPCVDCGESDPVVLEFDHVEGDKRKNITDMASAGYSSDTIGREISKCMVRCANCHRRRTSKQRGWFRK